MSREDRLEPQLLEQPVHFGGAEPRGSKTPQRVFETAFLRRRRCSGSRRAQVVAAPANAMDALGEVHHFEVRGEGVDQLARGLGVERADGGLKFLLRRSISFAPADRGDARRLDRLEQRLAALLANHITYQRAERANVVAQRDVLLRESDFAVRALAHCTT